MNRVLIALALCLNACGGSAFEYGNVGAVDHGDADVEAAVTDDAAPDAAPEADQEPDSGQVVADAGNDAHETGSVDADAAMPSCTHSNGLGQTYHDCSPLGTYTQATATEACIAFTGNAGQCMTIESPCSGVTGPVQNLICGFRQPGQTPWGCWDYGVGDQFLGRVAERTTTGTGICVVSSDPTWN